MDKKSEQYYISIGIKPEDGWREVKGVPNESADKVRRVDKTWSDTNLDKDHTVWLENDFAYNRLVCKNCGGKEFQVLREDHSTIAHCGCGFYYEVHNG